MFLQEVLDFPKLDLEIFKVHNTEGLSLDKVVMGGIMRSIMHLKNFTPLW